MLISRRKARSLATLEWRIRLFSIGGALGVGGVWFDSRPLVWAALAVLGIGAVLRFVGVEEDTAEGESLPDDSAAPPRDEP